MRTLCCLLCAAVPLWLAGCSSSGDASADDASADLPGPVDGSPAPEASPADAGPADAAPGCTLVPPRVGGTEVLDKLAKAPARCGQPAHSWLDSPKLGEIVSSQAPGPALAIISRTLLEQAKVEVPETLYDVVTEQIAYTTQDRGKLHESTALIAYPEGLVEPLGTIIVLHGTAGFTDGCSDSNNQRPILGAVASLGYIVVFPDFIGMRSFGDPTGFLHPYLSGQATAIASLDAVRAAARHVADVTAKAQAEDPTASPICASTRFVSVGGSQGGHAALWIDRLQPYYAPELEHVGLVAVVPPAAMFEHLVAGLSQLVPATVNTIGFYAATSEWYGAADRLGEVFMPPWDKDVVAAIAKDCDPSAVLEGKTLTDLFQPSLLAAAADPDALAALSPWGCMATENSLLRTSIERREPSASDKGVLYVLGENDELVVPKIERAAFDALCAEGLKLQYLECKGSSHNSTTTDALPEIIDFVRARLAGEPLAPAVVCKRGPATTCRGS